MFDNLVTCTLLCEIIVWLPFLFWIRSLANLMKLNLQLIPIHTKQQCLRWIFVHCVFEPHLRFWCNRLVWYVLIAQCKSIRLMWIFMIWWVYNISQRKTQLCTTTERYFTKIPSTFSVVHIDEIKLLIEIAFSLLFICLDLCKSTYFLILFWLYFVF